MAQLLAGYWNFDEYFAGLGNMTNGVTIGWLTEIFLRHLRCKFRISPYVTDIIFQMNLLFDFTSDSFLWRGDDCNELCCIVFKWAIQSLARCLIRIVVKDFVV